MCTSEEYCYYYIVTFSEFFLRKTMLDVLFCIFALLLFNL